MDFKTIKAEAIKLKNKALDYSSSTLASSGMTIDNDKDLEGFIEKSANTKFTDKETGEEKKFTKRVIAIFGEEKTDFFKEALYMLPVLAGKAFSQNVSLRLVKADSKEINLKNYKINELPALVVFENKKIIKQITKKENILKLVKSLDLDINSHIDKY